MSLIALVSIPTSCSTNWRICKYLWMGGWVGKVQNTLPYPLWLCTNTYDWINLVRVPRLLRNIYNFQEHIFCLIPMSNDRKVYLSEHASHMPTTLAPPHANYDTTGWKPAVHATNFFGLKVKAFRNSHTCQRRIIHIAIFGSLRLPSAPFEQTTQHTSIGSSCGPLSLRLCRPNFFGLNPSSKSFSRKSSLMHM